MVATQVYGPSDEQGRLAALRRYEVLDTPPDAALDHVARLSRRICQAEIALVSLVDEHRQWFKARIGLDAPETPRAHSFCAHAIRTPDQVFEVPDAWADPRFTANPLVRGTPHIRFYAGAPLVTPEGHTLGTLCVIDRHARELSPVQREVLRTLAMQVMNHLELVRRTRALDRALAEERRTSQALREKTAMLEAILATKAAAIVQLDPAGCILYANPHAEDILGLQPSAILGRRYDAPEWRSTAPDGGPWPDEQQPFVRVLATRQPVVGVEHAIEWPDGRRRQLSISGAPVLDDHGEVTSLVFAISDVTERHASRLAQAQAEQHARQAAKMEALGALAGGVAHDFNNVYMAVTGHAELARDQLSSDHPARAHLDQVMRASARARGLIGQILTFARQQPPVRVAVDLAELVGNVTRLLRTTVPPHVEFAVSIGDDIPDVLAEPSLLQQIVVNLATNALQAIGDRRGRIEISVRGVELAAGAHPSLAPGRHACLQVADDGPGIPPATQDRIFEPFFTTKAGAGTGLGLSVVDGIVKAHDGALAVTSSPGGGATFRVYLPALAEAEAVTAPPAGRVLVIEDDPTLRALHQRVLARAGREVVAFGEPTAALAALAAAPQAFALVLTDLRLPGLSGVDVARQARTLRPDLPVVLTTGQLTGAALEEARAAGVAEILHKPITLATLLAAFHRALGGAR